MGNSYPSYLRAKLTLILCFEKRGEKKKEKEKPILQFHDDFASYEISTV